MSKKALLMVHFGTTHDDTRELTINAMNNKFISEFNEFDFYEAYTSRIILKRLKARGIYKKNPLEVLDELYQKNYDEVYIQNSYIIPGMEYENLLEEAKQYTDKFQKIVIGKPLLYLPDDYRKVVDVLKDLVPQTPNSALVFCCHGTNNPIGATYPMLEYIFDEKAYPNVYTVSTITFPLIENVIAKMKREAINNIILTPFMFVAGEHAKNDMSEDFKNEFEENSIRVENIILKGLGEYEGIRNIFLEHLKYAIDNKDYDLAAYKKTI